MTGAPYGNVDIDRVVMHMVIRPGGSGSYRLAVDERALPSVEDMLDARFKMYKWVYGHHMVEALNELVAAAMGALINNVKSIQLRDFSWESYATARMTDNSILGALHDGVDNKESKTIMSIFRGILDRRYLPVSLLKWHPMDYDRFHRLIASKSKTQERNDVILRTIVAAFKTLREDPTMIMKTEEGDKEIALFPSPVIRSPYQRHPRPAESGDKPASRGDIIYIYSESEDSFSELTKASPYSNAVNEEWSNFPSYHLAYVMPSTLKSIASGYRREVEQMVTDRIASGM